MKKAVYIITAYMAFAGVLCFIFIMYPQLIVSYDSLSDSFDNPFMWYDFASNIFETCAYFALVILSLIQLKRPTPRLLLIFSGASFFGSFYYISLFQWWGFLYMAAGSLPAAYELITYGRLVRESPLHMQRDRRLFIAASVLACLCVASGIYSMISGALFYKKMGFIPPAYYLGIIGIAQSVCIVVFCFLKNRRTSVFYRMFFIGSSALGVLFFPVTIIFHIIMYAQPGNFYVDPMYYISSAISIALVLLILIHAFKTRHDGILPQEIELVLGQQTDTAAV